MDTFHIDCKPKLPDCNSGLSSLQLIQPQKQFLLEETGKPEKQATISDASFKTEGMEHT